MRGKKVKEVRKRMGRDVKGFYGAVEERQKVKELLETLTAENARLRVELAAIRAKTEDAEDAAWIGSIKTK